MQRSEQDNKRNLLDQGNASRTVPVTKSWKEIIMRISWEASLFFLLRWLAKRSNLLQGIILVEDLRRKILKTMKSYPQNLSFKIFLRRYGTCREKQRASFTWPEQKTEAYCGTVCLPTWVCDTCPLGPKRRLGVSRQDIGFKGPPPKMIRARLKLTKEAKVIWSMLWQLHNTFSRRPIVSLN